MARKKPSSQEPDQLKPKGRARDLGEVRVVSVEIPVALDDIVEKFAAKTHRFKKGVILLALEKLLEQEGYALPSK